MRLAACFDAKASTGPDRGLSPEAEALGIVGTPTFVINGRLIVNMASPAAFYRMIDEAWRRASSVVLAPFAAVRRARSIPVTK